MKNDIDELLSRAFGRRTAPAGEPQLTLGPQPETPAGKRPAPKAAQGGQKQPATQQAAPAQKPGSAHGSGPKPQHGAAGDAFHKGAHTVDSLQKSVLEMNSLLEETAAAQRAELEAMSQSALEDIARIRREVNTPAVQNLARGAGESEPLPGVAGAGAEAFGGLEEELGRTVLGQPEYLKALCIALKRPFVMGAGGQGPRSAFLISGPQGTGRRLGLEEAVRLLHRRRVFASGAVAWVDLALYPTPAQEKLFLQDVYAALCCDAEVVVFQNHTECHKGFLTVVANLITKGESPLAGRYVLQNGRLIDAGTALVPDAVASLSARSKYLVLFTELAPARLADSFGAPLLAALADVCETRPLSPAALRAIAEVKGKELCEAAQKNLGFSLSGAQSLAAPATAACGTAGSAAPLGEFFSRTYRALAQYKLTENAAGPVALCVKDGRPFANFGRGEVPLFSLLPQSPGGAALEDVKRELDALVGLAPVKEYVLRLEQNVRVQQRRAAQGLKAGSVAMHMIFTGNPGTGKTTIARLISKYLKAAGVLAGGQLIEVTRADLVGKYVGHTAPLTTQVMNSALGGVLFIDEAYSLYRGKDDSFGLEAIDTLVKGMEDHRDELVVILAGYTKEMQAFLSANSGLQSRFPSIVEFPDYTGAELLQILKLQAKSRGYVLDTRCDAPLLAYFNAVQLARARQAGNGRLARNKLEEAILAAARRTAADEAADLSLLLPEDFERSDIDG